MVVIKHIKMPVISPPDNPMQFQLITLIIGPPAPMHKPEAETQARPFEFVLGSPSKFSTMCPFCVAGFYVSASDITERFDCKFTWCPECGIGKPEIAKQPPPFEDPFMNPFESKQLNRCELDETVTTIESVPDSDSLTVSQRLSRRKCKE